MKLDAKAYRRRRNPEEAEALTNARAEVAPERAALKHGIYAGGLMICDECACAERCEAYRAGEECALEREYTSARARQVREVLAGDGQDPELHTALITSAVLGEIRLARAMRYVALKGELRPDLAGGGYEFTPVSKEIIRLQDGVEKRLEALNLTPRARWQLEHDKPAAANALVGLVRELALERQAEGGAPALEAEFEPAEDPPAATGDELQGASETEEGEGECNS